MNFSIQTDPDMVFKYLEEPDSLIIMPDFIQTRSLTITLLNKKRDYDFSRITTLDNYAKDVLGKDLKITPRFLERLITNKVLKSLGYYKEMLDYPDFITIFLNEYEEFSANVKDEFVISPNLRKLSEFHTEYKKELKRVGDYYTVREIAEIAIEKIEKNKDYSKIVFVNFFYIDNILYRFLEKLKEYYEIIMLYAPSAALSTVEQRLKPLLTECHTNEVNNNQEILFYSTPDKRREIIAMAQHINELVFSGKASFDHIMIAFRNAKKYENILKEIFESYNIPYFIEVRKRYNEFQIYQDLRSIINRFNPNEVNSFEQFLKITESKFEERVNDFNIEKKYAVRLFELIRKFAEHFSLLKESYGSKISATTFKTLLEEYISTFSFGYAVKNLNVVRVIDLGNLPFNYPEYLFVGDMSDDSFPHPYTSSMLVNDREKDQYPDFYYRSKAIDENNEKYYFDSIFKFAKNVVFTYSYLNDRGQKRNESQYIARLNKKVIEIGSSTYYRAPVLLKTSSIDEALYLNTIDSLSNLKIDRFGQIINFFSINNFEHLLDQEIQTQLSKKLKTKKYTPTEITAFKSCRLRYFYEYILNLKQPKILFSSTHIGELYHRVLKSYYSSNPEFQKVAKEERDEKLNDYIDKVLAEFNDSEKVKLLKLEMFNNLHRFLEFDKNFLKNSKTIETEKSFIYSIVVNDAPVSINGRIDRIDLISDDKILIIDYKYSKNLEKIKKEDLSLSIYTLARKNNVFGNVYYSLYFPNLNLVKGPNKLKIAILGYLNGKDLNNINTRNFVELTPISEAQFVELKREIIAIIAKIQELDFDKGPDEEESCGYCYLRGMCKFWRVENDQAE